MQKGEERWKSDSSPGQTDTWLASDGFLHNLGDDCFGCGGGRGRERRSAWEMRQSWSEMLVWKAEPAHACLQVGAVVQFPSSQHLFKTKMSWSRNIYKLKLKMTTIPCFGVMPVCTTRGHKEAVQLRVTSMRGRGTLMWAIWVWTLSGSLDKHSFSSMLTKSLNSASSGNFVANSLLTFYRGELHNVQLKVH